MSITPERLAILREARRRARAGLGEGAAAAGSHWTSTPRWSSPHSQKGAGGGPLQGHVRLPSATWTRARRRWLAGNAGANTTADHIAVLQQAMGQLPDLAWGTWRSSEKALGGDGWCVNGWCVNGWESNPPGTAQHRPTDGFEDLLLPAELEIGLLGPINRRSQDRREPPICCRRLMSRLPVGARLSAAVHPLENRQEGRRKRRQRVAD